MYLYTSDCDIEGMWAKFENFISKYKKSVKLIKVKLTERPAQWGGEKLYWLIFLKLKIIHCLISLKKTLDENVIVNNYLTIYLTSSLVEIIYC